MQILISIFLFCAPESATIVSQPQQHVMAAGPAVNETATISLTCLAEGWPLPAFQWYYNKKKIPGNFISFGFNIFNKLTDLWINKPLIRCCEERASYFSPLCRHWNSKSHILKYSTLILIIHSTFGSVPFAVLAVAWCQKLLLLMHIMSSAVIVGICSRTRM
jgi:hypothetical protein